eukprot:3252888-Prymnesium_polylepis.1
MAWKHTMSDLCPLFSAIRPSRVVRHHAPARLRLARLMLHIAAVITPQSSSKVARAWLFRIRIVVLLPTMGSKNFTGAWLKRMMPSCRSISAPKRSRSIDPDEPTTAHAPAPWRGTPSSSRTLASTGLVRGRLHPTSQGARHTSPLPMRITGAQQFALPPGSFEQPFQVRVSVDCSVEVFIGR